ncbi:MAG: restriction endonuclease subunit S [Acetatifactor sp.]|nr:restriction endonuclease subunit S [Acetatifactor sp.]
MKYKLCDLVVSANTGADAIKRAPILQEKTNLRCLRIGDVSQGREYEQWGFTKTSPEDYQRYKLHDGDILVARTGNTIGVNKYIEGNPEAVYNNGLIKIEADGRKIMPKYLYYIVRSKECQDYIQAIAYGTSTQPNMKIKDFLNFECDLLDIDAQKNIVNIVNAIERKIELNQKINRNLFLQAQTLYKSRFVDLLPFDGTMPSNWRLGTVAEIIELHDSRRIPLSSRERADLDKIYPYYGATSIMDYVDRYLFDGIYLLLGEDGTVVDDSGYPILQYVEGRFWVNNHAHILTGKNGFTVELLYLLFSLTNVKSIVTGAVQQKISQANLNKIEVVLPSPEELLDFDCSIQPVFSQIRNLRKESDNLVKLRDTLLPKLMSGVIDVSDLNL